MTEAQAHPSAKPGTRHRKISSVPETADIHCARPCRAGRLHVDPNVVCRRNSRQCSFCQQDHARPGNTFSHCVPMYSAMAHQTEADEAEGQKREKRQLSAKVPRGGTPAISSPSAAHCFLTRTASAHAKIPRDFPGKLLKRVWMLLTRGHKPRRAHQTASMQVVVNAYTSAAAVAL